MQTDSSGDRVATERIRRVIEQLVEKGSVTDADGVERSIFPVALNPREAAALRDWVSCERAVHTVEVGLAFGFSSLHICQALILNGDPETKHVVIDPNQLTGYAGAGLRVLQDAGVAHMVDLRSEESQLVLPQFLKNGRCFDLAFVDGNHRFDFVFVDLFYLGRLVRKGGVIILDDYNLPGIRRAVSFFVTNLDWTVVDIVDDRMVVLRTATGPDSRDFRFFAEF
jgi:predicted O-methyltransferase YrrM